MPEENGSFAVQFCNFPIHTTLANMQYAYVRTCALASADGRPGNLLGHLSHAQ